MASTYLQRASTGTNGNRKIWTFSCWIKRTALNSGSDHSILSMGEATNDESQLKFADDTINFFNDYATTGRVNMISNPPTKYRDLNGWYHLVFTHNVTESSNDDRWKIWINGDLMPASYYGSPTIPNEDGTMNEFNGMDMWIGARAKAQNDGVYFYLNANLSHVHFIDGTAYDATAFGEYDANGVWKINTSPSVTYGNNGFFILKDGNSVTDQSGNGNNFTVGGGTLTNTEDSPSNVFCTMNPLDKSSSLILNNGNTTTVSPSASWMPCKATIGMLGQSGKFYWEGKCLSGTFHYFGVYDASGTVRGSVQSDMDNNRFVYVYNGGIERTITGQSSIAGGTYATFGNGDVIGVALDKENGTITFYKNGTQIYTETHSSLQTKDLIPGTQANGSDINWNFGNGYFGTTAVASAGTNASGNGIFEYDVPTGYTALSTKGLNL